MRQSITRLVRKALPALEGLEHRMLLDAKQAGGHVLAQASAGATGLTLSGQQYSYTTPQGGHVVITLYGVGSLAGTTVDASGALNLVFSGTNQETGIVGQVRGGGGQASLNSIQNANLNIQDLSGIGSSVVNVVNLKNFNLVSGGRINLTGGVGSLYLNSVASNSQVNLRELPQTTTTTSSSTTGTSSTGSTSTEAPTTFTINGQTWDYASGSDGSLTLSSVTGQFTAGANVPGTPEEIHFGSSTAVTPNAVLAPPGVLVVITHVHGPSRSPVLGDPDIFGYDPTANTLIRFDAVSGAVLQTINLPSMTGNTNAGISLARDNGQLVVLVGNATTIYAYNAVTGALQGQFSTTNLAALGLSAIDGIASTGSATVVFDSDAAPDGLAQIINVPASLASGQAVAIGQPYSPQGQFVLSGGATGTPGLNTIFATGAAHLNSLQPSVLQSAVIGLNTFGGQIQESSLSPLLNTGSYQNVPPAQPAQAVGSVGQDLALVTGVTNGQNIVSLYAASTLQSQGTIALDDANPLSDLSGTFYPDLVDSALIDIQGNTQSLRGHDAQGLVLNDAGNLNLVKFGQATDTLIIGQPFSHAQMPIRNNVSILTTSRTVGTRNGVTIVPNLGQVGPLSLP